MPATELFKGEHRVIRQVLACLGLLAGRAPDRGSLDVISARQALDFLRHSVHGCHQEKEERLLFPLLEARGLPPDGGPTAVLRAEHARARRHLRAMAATVEGAGAGEPDARERFVTNARAYASLMREHIRKEDCFFFSVAGRHLARADQRKLLESFTKLEAEEGDGMYEHYLSEADQLAARWDVPCLAVHAGLEHACCG